MRFSNKIHSQSTVAIMGCARLHDKLPLIGVTTANWHAPATWARRRGVLHRMQSASGVDQPGTDYVPPVTAGQLAPTAAGRSAACGTEETEPFVLHRKEHPDVGQLSARMQHLGIQAGCSTYCYACRLSSTLPDRQKALLRLVHKK